MNGSFEKYATEKGTRWAVRWELPDGDGGRRQRRKRGFATKGEASKYLRHALSEQDQGRPVEFNSETVSEAAESFLTAKRAARKAETTLDLWGTVLAVHVIPRIGHMRTSTITDRHVEALYAVLSEHGKAAGKCRTAGLTCEAHDCKPEQHDGLSPSMMRHVHTTLRAVLRRSLGERAHLPTDTSRAKDALPKVGAVRVGKDDYWSDEQARQFIAATEDIPYGAIWSLALATGLRRAELAGLRWSDLELDGDEPTLHVRQTITVVRGRMVLRDGGKTGAAMRDVPLGALTTRMLKAHRLAQMQQQMAAQRWADSDAVFTDDGGNPINPQVLTRAFTAATTEAGLPQIGLHGARHFAITSMLRRGVPVTTVAKIVGHEKPSITFDVYSHAIPDDTRLAAAAIDAALGDEITAL